MGRRKLLQLSTVQKFDGSWTETHLSGDDLRWIRKNLSAGSDTKRDFERTHSFHSREGTLPQSPFLSLPEKWTDRVIYLEGQLHPHVLLKMGRRYGFQEKFDRSYQERDPDFAPHIAFSKLIEHDNVMALEFMKEFGPLTVRDYDIGALVWIDLNDFWVKHARFVAIVHLYELLADGQALRVALTSILENRDLLNAAGPAPVGCIPDPQEDQPFPEVIPLSNYRSDEYLSRSRDGRLRWSHSNLRDHARRIVWAELTLQTYEGLRCGWELIDKEEGMGFRPTRVVTSLWAAIWETVGLETGQGCTWRSCRECGKYFYPLQTNSKCCTPEHQALWSKREYARKRREANRHGVSIKKPRKSD